MTLAPGSIIITFCLRLSLRAKVKKKKCLKYCSKIYLILLKALCNINAVQIKTIIKTIFSLKFAVFYTY